MGVLSTIQLRVWGFCPRGFCPWGFCPRGFCPYPKVTIPLLLVCGKNARGKIAIGKNVRGKIAIGKNVSAKVVKIP